MPQALPTIQVGHGNTVVVPFRLRLRGQRDGWDVSLATRIQLDVELKDGEPSVPILADSAHALADWEIGRVPIVLSPANITAVQGLYEAVLTVFLPNEEISAPYGHLLIDVFRRPGYPAPAPAP